METSDSRLGIRVAMAQAGKRTRVDVETLHHIVQAAGETLDAPRHRPIHGVPPLMAGPGRQERNGRSTPTLPGSAE
jgi:hypothetical protein